MTINFVTPKLNDACLYEECAVCLDTVATHHNVKAHALSGTPSSQNGPKLYHAVHDACLAAWNQKELQKWSLTCPTCRQPIQESFFSARRKTLLPSVVKGLAEDACQGALIATAVGSVAALVGFPGTLWSGSVVGGELAESFLQNGSAVVGGSAALMAAREDYRSPQQELSVKELVLAVSVVGIAATVRFAASAALGAGLATSVIGGVAGLAAGGAFVGAVTSAVNRYL